MTPQLAIAPKLRAQLLAAATKPFAYWSFAADASETFNTTGTAFGTKTATGTPDFATTAGRLTLDNSTYYTYDTATNAGLKALLDLGEGAIAVFATVNVNASETGQSPILSVHTGAGENWRIGVTKSTSWRHDVSIAFDGETSVNQYAGGNNEFASGTDVNLCWLIDNRVSQKQLYRWANGVALGGQSWAGKGACNFDDGPTKRIRIGADSAGTPSNTSWLSIRRLSVVNYAQAVPARINDIVASMNASNNRPTRLLLASLA